MGEDKGHTQRGAESAQGQEHTPEQATGGIAGNGKRRQSNQAATEKAEAVFSVHLLTVGS
jgi:hypothetical protein